MIRFGLLAVMLGVMTTGLFSQCFYPHPEDTSDNIEVQRLAGDSLSSVFAIWVKQEVRPHYHASHSETVVVLEGEGRMRLGDEEFEVKPGATVFIPKAQVHSVKVTSDEPLKVISIQAPHFDGTDRIFVD